jgi:hypothetical protein
MPAKIPVLRKTPFVFDPRPLEEMGSPHAGLLATSRALRSLNLSGLVEANLKLKLRQSGFSEGQMIESIVLLQTLGGDCPEDVKLLGQDACLTRGLGYQPPKVTAVRDFLERFHDEDLAQLRPSREEQKSFIQPRSKAQCDLDQVHAGIVGRIARLYEKAGVAQRIATVDQDATIIESHKRSALPHYEGGRGYQPMVAHWAEADLILASEFRDGNVPARQSPLNCAQMAFSALPPSVKERYFRGDSACHQNELITWLNHADRAQEPGGRIGFCVSAVMEPALAKAVAGVGEKAWKTYGKEADGTLRQWAEVAFVPSQPYEHKQSTPLRYVGLRLLKAQGSLFADNSDRKHYAVISNLDWDGARLLKWHREKAGTIEHVHDEIKNALAGGHMPNQKLAVNAAWFSLSLLAYNVASAIKGLCLNPKERTVRFKAYRLLLVHLYGRMSRFQCKLRLRLLAPSDAIERFQKVWEVFDLPTQATAFA